MNVKSILQICAAMAMAAILDFIYIFDRLRSQSMPCLELMMQFLGVLFEANFERAIESFMILCPAVMQFG